MNARIWTIVALGVLAAGCNEDRVSGPTVTPTVAPPAAVEPSPFPTHKPHPPAPPVVEEPTPGPGQPGPKPQPTPTPKCRAHEPHGEDQCKE